MTIYTSINKELLTPKLKREVQLLIKKAKQYKLSEDAPIVDIVGYLTDFNAIRTNKNCGGYYDSRNKEMAFNDCSTHTVAHEISHHIQTLCNIDYDYPTISGRIRYEQQCESVAYLLHNGIFKPQPPYKFNSYFKKADHLFLLNWYGEQWVQDDMKLLSK